MSAANPGNTVRIHYTGTLTDGTRFDTSEGRDPLEFKLGAGEIIPGLDAAIAGMAVGDSKTVTIPCDEAYGPHRAELVQDVERQHMPDDIELEVGTELQATAPNGQTMRLRVIGIGDASVTLDANHPLAGQDLVFEVEVVDIAA